jgi:tryptophan synthase
MGFITESLKYFSTPSTRCPSPAIEQAKAQLKLANMEAIKKTFAQCKAEGRVSIAPSIRPGSSTHRI